jgi:hypothetical protein
MKRIAHTLRAVREVVTHARSSSELFKLIWPGEGEVLNAWPEGALRARGVAVLDDMARLRHMLKAEAYVTEEARVDYARLSGSLTFAALVDASRGLRALELEDVQGEHERKALFINLYNMLMIHAVIALKIERSVMEVPTIFSSVGYQVGEHVWTLDAMEHGALRANAPHPTTKRRAFSGRDARVAWMVPLDARVHMALVCAAHSCPPIRMYGAEGLDDQLDMASSAFVQGTTHVDHETRRVETSSLFDWYRGDFASTGGVQAFLLRHSDGELRLDLSRAFAQDYTWIHTAYDWSLNGL